MKKILSLCLALVMLLGMVAMTVSAEGEIAFDGYYVSLGDDISLNFTLTGLTAGETYQVDVNGKKIAVVGAEDGTGVAKFTGLTPAMLDTPFTATLGDVTITKSVKDYCSWALTNMALSNATHALIVNLLDYAAAAQTYTGATASANAWLNDLQKDLAVSGDAAEKEYLASGDQTGKAITWTGASLALKESVAYRFYFAAESLPEGLKFVATMEGGAEVEITEIKTDDNGYYVDFTALTPADLRKDVTIVAKNAEGDEISVPKIFSAERYAAYAADNESEATNALMNAILAYNKAAVNYNNDPANEHLFANAQLRDIATGALTAAEKYRLSAVIAENFTALEMSKFDKHICGAYKQIGVDVSKYYPGETSYTTMFYAIWSSAGKLNGKENYWNLSLLENVWGGTYHGENNPAGVVTLSTFETGDIFVGRLDYFNYKLAIYLGNGKFLVLSNSGVGEIWTYDVNGTESIYNWIESQNADAWNTYYILRPSQLAN